MKCEKCDSSVVGHICNSEYPRPWIDTKHFPHEEPNYKSRSLMTQESIMSGIEKFQTLTDKKEGK